MKKIISFLFLALILAIVLGACEEPAYFQLPPGSVVFCDNQVECDGKAPGTTCLNSICVKLREKVSGNSENIGSDGEPSAESSPEPLSELDASEPGTELLPERKIEISQTEPETEPQFEKKPELNPEGPEKCLQEGMLRQCNVPGALGPCARGNQRCESSGAWSVCTGRSPDPAEICGNGVDDNCDGQIDEGC